MYVCFRYKKPEERQPLVAAMHIFMPMLKERFIQLLPDHSSDSVLIQKQIFKILYALFQVISQHLTFSLCGFDGHHNFQKPKVTPSNCFFCQTNSPKRKDSLTSNMTKKSNKSLYLRSCTLLCFSTVQPSSGTHQQTEPDRMDGDPEDSSGQRCSSSKEMTKCIWH